MMQPEQAYAATMFGGVDERTQIVMDELPQVYYIARRIHQRLPTHVPFEDLVHAGVLGLIEALRSFDPSKNVQIKTFAQFRIRGAILDSLRELDWGSRPLRQKGRQVEDAIVKLEGRLGRQPTEHEIASELNLTLEALHKLLARLDALDLLGQEVGSSYDRSGNHDLIESAESREENPFDACARTEIKELLTRGIEKLSEKEQLVVSLYYREELTMKEIAAVLQLAESRISQIHSLALAKLRAEFRRAKLRWPAL